VELVLRQAEVLYRDLSPELLHNLRCKRGVRYNEGRDKVANDEVCEMMNADYERMSPSKSIGGVVEKSKAMAPMKQSKKFLQVLRGRGFDFVQAGSNKVAQEDAVNESTVSTAHGGSNSEAHFNSNTTTDADSTEHSDEDDDEPPPSFTIRPITVRSTREPERKQTRMQISELIEKGEILQKGKKTDDLSLWPQVSKLKVPLVKQSAAKYLFLQATQKLESTKPCHVLSASE